MTAKTSKVRLTAGPLLLGVQDIMVSMPANLSPIIGVACEVLRFLPDLKMLVQREFMQLHPGDAVMCTILSAGMITKVYLAITRRDEQHLESLSHFETAMEGIRFHAHLKGVTTLATVRPPGCGFALNWKHVVEYFDTSRAARYLKFVICIGTRKSPEEWAEDLDAARERRERVPILDAYDPEDPMFEELDEEIEEFKQDVLQGRPFRPY